MHSNVAVEDLYEFVYLKDGVVMGSVVIGFRFRRRQKWLLQN
jgi:hypothetical protein